MNANVDTNVHNVLDFITNVSKLEQFLKTVPVMALVQDSGKIILLTLVQFSKVPVPRNVKPSIKFTFCN